MQDGYGFVRVKNYFPSENDIYVSQTQIKKTRLRIGDQISGYACPAKEGERYASLYAIEAVNYVKLEGLSHRKRFIDLVTRIPENKRDYIYDKLEIMVSAVEE